MVPRRALTLALTALTLCSFGLFVACSRTPRSQTTLSGNVMGTTYNVVIVHDGGSSEPAPDFYGSVQGVLDHVDELMSTYKPDSEISRFNDSESTDWFPVSRETVTVVQGALKIARLTHGAFDPTIGPLVDVWGFGPQKIDRPPTGPELDAARALVAYENIEVKPSLDAIRKAVPGTRLDLSAIAKGFAVDQLHDFLIDNDYEDFLVEVGGEVRVSGENARREAWRVGIDAPTPGPRTAGGHKVAIAVDHAAVATSGDYRNFRMVGDERVSHTLDPRAGRPIAHSLASVTIVARTCMEADALATAVNVLGPTQGWGLLKQMTPDVTGYLILHDGDDRFVEKMEQRFHALVIPDR